MNINTVIVKHPGTHGFFSYCSMALIQSVKYYYTTKCYNCTVDMSEIFTTFKNNDDTDISDYFFKKKVHNTLFDNINFNDEIVYFIEDLQFTNYHDIKYHLIVPFVIKNLY